MNTVLSKQGREGGGLGGGLGERERERAYEEALWKREALKGAVEGSYLQHTGYMIITTVTGST